MEYFYLIYIIIPLMIVLNAMEADTVETKKVRLMYSIPSILMILFIALIYFLRYIEVVDFLELIDYNPELFLVPILLSLIPVIFYLSGKRREKYLYVDMAIEEAEIVRERKSYNKKIIDVNIKTDEDIEIL